MDKYEENPDEIINEIIKQKSNNMEFKGTKGNWNYNGNEIIYDENGYAVIPSGNVNFEEKEYNFKLASKAPEMLEMLQKCRKTFKEKYNLTVLELDNLIKEATTL